MENTSSMVTLDLEWLVLILQAKGIGLNPEEVRYFLREEEKKS
ncbi:DNA-binding anti-repressor SinI [Oceanobacillus sp. CAU 1775]